MTAKEPDVIINGIRLSEGQVITLRVALSVFDCLCGDDEHGKALAAAYAQRRDEIIEIMMKNQGDKP